MASSLALILRGASEQLSGLCLLDSIAPRTDHGGDLKATRSLSATFPSPHLGLNQLAGLPTPISGTVCVNGFVPKLKGLWHVYLNFLCYFTVLGPEKRLPMGLVKLRN